MTETHSGTREAPRKFPRREYPTPVFWLATTPEYQTHHGADHFEPPEYGRDCLCIRARSAHRAKVLAIRAWRRGLTRKVYHHSGYVERYCGDENPMAVVTIERLALAGDAYARAVGVTRSRKSYT